MFEVIHANRVLGSPRADRELLQKSVRGMTVGFVARREDALHDEVLAIGADARPYVISME